MTTVAIYGLCIQSEIPLPEAPVISTVPQVLIRLGKVAPPPGDSTAECNYIMNRNECRVYWRGVGKFVIRSGTEVLVEPDADSEAAAVRLYLLGPVLGMLLHQRGFLVLHASVVSIDGAAVGFLGEKGWGKSTTAAALNARGYALVADDILAVLPFSPREPMVQPGLPNFKLWPEAAAASFGDDPTKLVRLHSNVEKRFRGASAGVGSDLMPLRRLYLLGQGPSLESIPMAPPAALLSLVRHSYLSRLMHLLGGTRENFEQCARVVQSVPMNHLQRPKNLKTLGDIVSLVEDDMGIKANLSLEKVALCR